MTVFHACAPTNHPDVHFVPARRSSDLTGAIDCWHLWGDAGAGKNALPFVLSSFANAAWCGLQCGRRILRTSHLCGPGTGDRKSTRLNSSHVATSYAVFCLKKKNSYART